MTDSNLFPLTEAAERTGLSVDALRKRIRRGRLETVKGNDGLVRVRLTAADMDGLRLGEGQPTASHTDETGWTIKALQAEVAGLRERADKAEAQVGRVKVALAAERDRATLAERERENARIAAATAEGEVRGLREALAEARRPWWRRLVGD
jgi:chromosome segregation ATPase